MDSLMYLEVLKLIVILPVIIILIIITLRYSGKYMSSLTNGKIIKIYERVPVGKDTFLMIVTIADKPYLVTNGNNGVEILQELDEEMINNFKKQALVNEQIKKDKLFTYLDRVKGKMKNEKI